MSSSESVSSSEPVTFADLGLSQKVLDAVTATGYTSPTPIQAQAIPHVLQRKDVLGIAQTGTGKTAAFTLPMLSLLEQGRARARMPRTLILEPTRELAAQVEEAFTKYGANQKLSVALLIGGVSFNEQDVKISRGADVLIATPGRLLDHFERGKLLLTGIEILVIDEADRMLDMGFIPDIEKIASLCPFTRQTLFFTATMPPEIQRVTAQFLSSPIKIEVGRPSSTAVTITQHIIPTHRKDYAKRETLRGLIRAAQAAEDGKTLKNGIVFCNRKSEVATLARSLERHGFSVGALHGDMDQRARMASLEAFRGGKLTLLIASDVAARGLDIPDVSHVFNYDIPTHAEDYVHRIGRTGRAGRLGTAYTLVAPGDEKYLDAIQKLINRPIEWENGDLSTLGAPPVDDESRKPRRGGRDERGRETKSRRNDPHRGTGPRGKDADPSARPVDAAMEPILAPVPRPERPAREERPAKEERPAREERVRRDDAVVPPREARATRNAESAQDRPRQDRPRQDAPKPARQDADMRRDAPRRRPREDDDGPSPIGFGDALPGFLARPVSVKKP